MNRSTRRRLVSQVPVPNRLPEVVELPEVAPRVLPLPFSDDSDPLEPRESFWSAGDSTWSVSRPRPYVRAAPRRIPSRSAIGLTTRGKGRSPLGSQQVRQGPSVFSLHRARYLTPPLFPAKQTGSLNALQTPVPRSTRYCVQRKQRREVLFALRSKRLINRRSPGGAGGYRRNLYSQWRC